MMAYGYESTSPFDEPFDTTHRPELSNGNLRQNKLHKRILLNNHGATLHYFSQEILKGNKIIVN